MNKIYFSSQLIIKLILGLFIFINESQAALFLEGKNNQATVLQAKHQQEVVILIHGLMRSPLSMSSLKYFLQSYGYPTYIYHYPSTQHDIQKHGIYLYQFITDLLKKNPHIKVHFVTHSLGGIIVRESLAKFSKKQLRQMGYLVMLAPPNQGSTLARLTSKLFPAVTYIIKPLAELSTDKNAYIHRVPIPPIKMGILAGRYDVKVPPSSAGLPGQIEPVIINTNHAFIMDNAHARQLILAFLEKGKFAD